MIKFFRKIRQRLLSEGKAAKYVGYAIGEIVLVVIGILIALQINNWNEKRKEETKSIEYLQRLKVDVENVLDDVNGALESTEQRYKQALIALEVLEKKELNADHRKDFERHLKQYFQFSISVQNTVAYNEMISAGDLGLIKNEWLRTAFANLSEYREFIIEVNQSNHNAYKTNTELFEKHVRYGNLGREVYSSDIEVFYDFEEMTKDDLFINRISNQAYTWRGILRLYESYEEDVQLI